MKDAGRKPVPRYTTPYRDATPRAIRLARSRSPRYAMFRSYSAACSIAAPADPRAVPGLRRLAEVQVSRMNDGWRVGTLSMRLRMLHRQSEPTHLICPLVNERGMPSC